ncbi:hypothetical protein FRC10_007218, partial [Ceratobasidium sp. 414]
FNDAASTNNMSSSRDPTLAGRPHPQSLGIESGKHRSASLVRSPRGQGRGGYGADTFELGVRVQTETHMETDELPVSARAVELQRAGSFSSTTGTSAKGVPVQYDLERGDDKYEDTRQYELDAKPRQ